VVDGLGAAYYRQSTGQAGLGAQPPLGLHEAVGAHEAEQVVFALALGALAFGAPLPAKARVEVASRAASKILFIKRKK